MGQLLISMQEAAGTSGDGTIRTMTQHNMT